MLKNKLSAIGALLMSTTLIALPITARADLTIVNNTDYDSTSVVNGGACSTILGQAGITKAHSSNTLDYILMRIACGMHPSDCVAEVYMTDNCSGPVVATVTMDIDNGISNIQESGAFSLVQDTPFKLEINNKG
jgi:hypothetical protein